MNQVLNDLIPKAIEAIKVKIALENGDVVKEYKGYLNSMGSGLIQAGLITMLAFCTDRAKKKEETDRNNVLQAIFYMMNPSLANNNDQHLLKYILSSCLKEGISYDQEEKITSNDLDLEKIEIVEAEIMDHVLALKMAIKTFHLVENPKKEKP